MGNCATSPQTAEEYEKYMTSEKEILFESDISPINAQDASAPIHQEDINRINDQNKEIHFLVRIDRIKIRNVGNYTNVFCKFKFADKIPLRTHILSSTGSYWRSQFNFDFIALKGLQTLREKQIEIELWTTNQQNNSESLIGQASIPLIKICEGPFHIDYQLLNNKRAPCGRITFNCTMEQQCVWGLKLFKTQIKLKDSGEMDITEGNHWSIQICKTNADSEDRYASADTSIPVVTDQVGELDAEKKHQLIALNWQESELFEVSFSGTFREFVREPLKFLLRNTKSVEDPHYTVFGECWISLEKAYSLYIRHPNRAAEIRHHLWWNGVNVGEVSVFYQFTELCMVQQMLSGVNSEKGISAGSTVILSSYSKNLFRRDVQEIPPQINEITRLYKSFLDLKTSSVHNDKEQVDVLERIIGYLRNTDKDSMVSYMYVLNETLKDSYHSEASLFRSQCALLDILDAFGTMLWDLSYTVKNVVFEVIFRLLKRSELSDLYLLGFDPAKQTEPRKEDIELASNLRRILLHILHDVLQRINEKGISQRLSVYCSRIISICMFCIPEFGQEVTNTLWDPSIVNMLHHSNRIQPAFAPIVLERSFTGSSCSLLGTELSTTIDSEETQDHPSPATLEDMVIMEGGGFDSTFQITPSWLTTILHICKIHPSFAEHVDDSKDLLQRLLDWRPLTQHVLKYNIENNLNPNDTDFFTQNTDWKRRIAIRGNLYNLISEAWLQKVLSVLTNMHREIQWPHIRGYNELLLSFAYQLERVPLMEINDSMTKVMRTFLSNEHTLSLFVRILILKTRPYSLQEVTTVLELIDSLFCSYRRWRDRLERSRHPNAPATEMKLPNTFSDYPFVDGLIQLLHSDINQVVIKTMELLYHHWDLLRDSQKHVFLTELFSAELAKKLFLHWNVNVRQFYYYLTIYWLTQIPANDRKNKVDVYSFLKEFAKAMSQKPSSVKLPNIHSVQLKVLTSSMVKSRLVTKEMDIRSMITSRVDSEAFWEDLMVFSLEDFRAFSATVLTDISPVQCDALLDYLQLLALVFKGVDDEKVFYCCSPAVLNQNYDCFLFSPHAIDLRLTFYQEQLLMARFFAFVRNVKRISMYNLEQRKDQFIRFQQSLHNARECCHNEAINKFNMQQMMIDKIVSLDLRTLYEENLVHCEIMDAILKGEDFSIPTQLYPYAFNAMVAYDDLFKKHERDLARNNNDPPFLHWQTIFPTNLLSAFD